MFSTNMPKFTKTLVTTSGIPTYSIQVKETIASQYYHLLRQPGANQSNVSTFLANHHSVVPATILTWVKKHGETIVTPTPKVGERKAKPTTPKPKTPDVCSKPKVSDEFSFDKLVSGVSLIDNSSILDKVLKIIKSIPAVDISIAIRPTNK